MKVRVPGQHGTDAAQVYIINGILKKNIPPLKKLQLLNGEGGGPLSRSIVATQFADDILASMQSARLVSAAVTESGRDALLKKRMGVSDALKAVDGSTTQDGLTSSIAQACGLIAVKHKTEILKALAHATRAREIKLKE